MTTNQTITLSPDEQAEARHALAVMNVAPHIINDGIEGLLRDWHLAVNQCEQGYHGCLEAYRNDLYGRDLIHHLQHRVSQSLAAKIAALVEDDDRRMHALLIGDECMGDEEELRRHQLSPAVEWWYFGYPRTGKPE